MAREHRWRSFGVKTLYRSAPRGRPKGRDRFYAEGVTLVEERVVVFKARSFEEAIKRAEREASVYARDRYRNAYGQVVVTRYLGYCDAYEMSDSLGLSGVEVYSSTEIVPARKSDQQIAGRVIGAGETAGMTRQRRNIMNIVFVDPVPGVRLNPEEREFVKWREEVRRQGELTSRGSK